jgi:methionyl-tRNA formyltransferase
MKIGFAGTPDFAGKILEHLICEQFNIVAVISQMDKPAGRGKKLRPPPVKKLALKYNLPLFQPQTLKDESGYELIKNLNLDVLVVVAYGQILPQKILDLPKYGCLNIHTSLLPHWRGAAPIQRAIEAGDTQSGVCIMQMDASLDTGDILLKKECEIKNDDTTLDLYQKLITLSQDAISEVLNNLDTLQPKQQQGEPTYAQKLQKDEAWINWQDEAQYIYNKIRAFNPYPIAQTYFNDDKILRIIEADLVDKVDKIIQTKNKLIIPAKNGAISLKTVQLAGKKAVDIKDFNNAYQVKFVN